MTATNLNKKNAKKQSVFSEVSVSFVYYIQFAHSLIRWHSDRSFEFKMRVSDEITSSYSIQIKLSTHKWLESTFTNHSIKSTQLKWRIILKEWRIKPKQNVQLFSLLVSRLIHSESIKTIFYLLKTNFNLNLGVYNSVLFANHFIWNSTESKLKHLFSIRVYCFDRCTSSTICNFECLWSN